MNPNSTLTGGNSTCNLGMGRIKTFFTKKGLFYLFMTMFMTLGMLHSSFAQLTGSKFIPGDYLTVTAAVADLNAQGVGAGGVTFEVTAGYTETLAGRLDITATGTLADPIVFRKDPATSGANPLLTAYTGTALATGAAMDGMLALVGSDYVTIDGIDLTDPNTASATTMMEYGYGLFKASATDGANNNTIQNCTITLNRNNNTAPTSGPAFQGSNGIALLACTQVAMQTGITVTAASGASSNNKFYSNTIQNVNAGITLSGFAATTPFTLADTGNDIGGASGATGNTIINFGGGTGATNACAAVFVKDQWGFNVSYNTVNNNNGSGVNHPATNRGIFANASSIGASATFNNNNVTITGGASTSAIDWCLDIEMAQSGASGNTINVNNNTVSFTKPGSSTVAQTAIWLNTAATTVNCNNNNITNFTCTTTSTADATPIRSGLAGIGTLNINNNTFSGITFSAATGTNYIVSVTATVTTALNINGNSINGVTLTAPTSKIFRGIYVSTASNTADHSISNNDFQNITYAGGTPTGEFTLIYGIGTAMSYNINNNTLTGGLTVPSTGTMYCIYNSQSSLSINVSNNNMTGTGINRTSASGTFKYYYNFGVGSGVQRVSNNICNNVTLTGSSAFYGIEFRTSTTPTMFTDSNTITNNVAGSGISYGIYNGYGAAGSSVSGNTVSGLAGTGTIYGIYIGSTASIGLDCNNNNVNGISTTGTSGIVYGIYQSLGGVNNYSKNKIYGISANGTGASAIGLHVNAGTTTSLRNNYIGDMSSPLSNLANPLIGININGGTTAILDYNTVNINGTSAGALFGSSALSASTTPNLTLRNNIFVNNSTPNGAGFAVAYRRSSTTISSHNVASNNNLFYAGTPSANNLIFYDGTNSDQSVMSYKARVFTADMNSGTENPTFLSTVGSSPDFLHIDASVATNIESGAVTVSGISDDFDGDVRNGSTPDMGADEFSGTVAAALAAPINFGSNTATINSFNITWDDNSVGEAGFVVYRSLNIGGPFNTIVGVVSSTSVATTGTPYSLPQTGLLGGTTYYYQVVANNFSSSAALAGSAATLGCGSGLVGTYLIPTTYATLTAAMADLVLNGMNGPVTLELESTYTGAGETYPIVIGNIGCLNPANPLTIRPEGTVAAPLTITSANTTATIDINNGNFVTIDGRPGGVGSNKFLIVENTSTTSGSSGNAVLIRNESSDNTLTYLDVRAANGNAAANTAVTTAGAIPGAIAISNTTGGFGNDNNIISNCDVHSTGANLGVCIYSGNNSTAGSNANNDNGSILNNNLYDFFIAASASAAVDIAAGNNNWTVSGNNVYQTASRAYTGTPSVRGFWITPNTGSLASASGYVINDNFIGGSAAGNSGAPTTMTGSGLYNYYGMDLSLGLGTASSVQNNTISNFNVTGPFTGNNFYGINVANGNVNVGSVTGNVIGSPSTNGSITITTTSTGGSMIGLRSGAGGTINFSNNIVSGIDMVGSATTVATGFNGIAASGGAIIIVNNNTIGSSTLANSINMVATSSTSTTAAAVRGIICNSTTTGVVNTITNNTVANINSNYSAAGTQAATLVGIAVTTGASTVDGNTIYNLSSNTQTSGSGATSGVIGISYNSTAATAAPAVISDNIVHTLRLTNPSSTGAINGVGLFYSGPTGSSNVIERNLIHSISTAATANSLGFLTGMDVAGGVITLKNNMVRLGIDDAGLDIVSPLTVRGITKNAATANVWNNSVYIGGANVGTNAINTFAFARTGTAVDDIRNNIFVNNRSNATTGGKHYAINLVNTTTLTLNYNDYYVSGLGGVLGYNGVADAAVYTTGWVAGDVNSFSVDPEFINANGDAASVDLHIHPTNPTIIEGTGEAIANVVVDFDSQTRAGLTPTDIGADAGNFVSLVCSGTPIGGTAIVSGSAICITGSTTVSLTGFSNIPGITLQWKESSVAGGPYTNVSTGTGGTTASYTTGTLTADNYYICEVTCTNGGATALSSEVLVVVNNPTVTSTTPGTRCGTGVVTLSATANNGGDINWFADPTGGVALTNPTIPVPVTGFNNDIVANGVGTNSSLGFTYATIGVDGAGYLFIDNTYKYAAANALPTCFMPVNKLAPSAQTSGLVYEFQDYGDDVTLVNNAMSIVNQSTGYVSPLPSSGTLTLTTPASYSKLVVLYESVVNTAPMLVDATVTFTDASTQVINGNTCVNWFTVSAPAYSGMGRATPTGAIQCGTTPNMFELNLPISLANQSKQVASVTLSLPAVLTGVNAFNMNYFHAMAVGGQVATAPGSFTTPIISTTTTYYAEPASAGGSNQISTQPAPTTTTSTQNGGLRFNLNVAVTINSIQVFSNAAGTATVTLLNPSGGVMFTSSAQSIVNGGLSTPQTLNLGWSVPAGTGYRIQVANTGNALGYATGVFPQPMGNGVGTIVSGSLNGADNTLHYFVYNINTTAGCLGSRVAVVATVTPPPALTITPGTTVCNNTVQALSVTSTVGDFDVYTWSPVTNLFEDVAATIPYTGGNFSTVYLKSTTGGSFAVTCNALNTTNQCANVTSQVYSVQSLITASITSDNNPSCAGTDVVLTANLVIPPSPPIGAGATTSATYSNPFYSLWSNTHMQHLVLASELTAANIQAGNIVSLGLDITVAGTLPMLEFSLKMANSSATNMSSYDASSFTTVYTNASLMPTVGINTLTFTTPFVWDGVSNVVIEICHGNPGSTATMSRTCKADNTSFVSTIHTHKTVSTGGNSQCTDNTTNLLTYSLRPQFYFTNSPASITYSWSDGMSVVGTTNPLTVNPTSNTDYTVTANISGCDIVSPLHAQTTIALPPAPTASAASTQCGFAVPTVSVTSNSTEPTPFFYWYDAPTGGNLLQTGTSTTFTGVISTTTTFYVSEFVAVCESPRVAAVANVTAYDPIDVTANQVTCVGTPNTFTVTQTGSNNVYALSWSANPMAGSGVIGTETGSVETFTTTIPGFYSYIVTGTETGTGCVASDTIVTNNYVGLSGTVSATQISGCDNPNGLITANVTGAGTVLNDDFTSGILPSNMTSAGNDFALIGGQMRFTSSALSKNGGVLITNTTGLANDDFQIDFDMITTPGSGSPADGFSYSYGSNVVALPATVGSPVVGQVVGPTESNPESGSGTGLKLGFDAYTNGANTAGIYLMYNCPIWNQTPASSGVIAYINNVTWRATTTLGKTTHVTIKINALGQVSLWLNGVQVVTDAPLPASYLTDDKSTWNHAFCARTGGEYQGHYIDNLLIQYNNFYEYSIDGGTSWTTNNPIPASGPGTYTVLARYASVPACSTSIGSATIDPIVFTTTSTSNGVCTYSGSMPTFGITPAFTSATYQWESSPAGMNTWSPISGATSATYVPAPGSITVETDFRCVISCGGVPHASSPSSTKTITIDTPVITGSTGASRCGVGTVDLQATGSANTTLNWYTAATGGVAIGTGNTFTTPTISSSTNFYVAASANGGQGLTPVPGGNTWDQYTTVGNFQTAAIGSASMVFDALTTLNIATIDIYPSATLGTSFTIEVRQTSSTGTLVASYTGVTTVVNSGSPTIAQTVPVNFNIPAGSNYVIGFASNPSTWRGNITNFPYPFLLPGILNIQGSSFGTSPGSTLIYQYFFYNWVVTTGCESARTAVAATVTTPPAITVSSNVTICDGQSTTLTVGSTNDPDYSYVWTPSGFNGSSYSVNPTANTTYTVTATDTTAGPNAGCATVGSVTVSVNPIPSVPSITQDPLVVCGSSPVTLTATSTQPGVAQVGTGTGTNVSVGQSPFSGNWEGSKIQYLMTAAELNSLNIYAGQLTSVAFNVTNIGVTFAMSAFTVKIGQTATAALTGYESGLTQVYAAPGTILPTSGWNTFTFSSPFMWNGTSNVVIEVCHNNDPTGACASCYGGTSTVQSTTTATQTVYGQYADNTTPTNPWDLCSQISTGTVSQSSNRPNMQIGYGATTNFLWSTGAPTAAIVVTPPVGTTNYSVVATNVFGCTSTNNIDVTTAAIAKPVIAENDTTLCNPEFIYVHVQDTGAYSGGYPSGTTFTWSAIGVPLPDLDSISSSGNGSSYSVIVTLPNGCTSSSDTTIVLTKSVAVVDVINNATCSGGGSIEVEVTSGLANYNYVWSTDLAQTNIVRNVTLSSNRDTLANLTAGTYYLQVYDEAGTPASCNSGVLTYVVSGSNPIDAAVTATDITCFGSSNGNADVTWTGGNAPYSITWSDANFANTTPRSISLAGNYSVIVSDLSGCADTVAFTIVEPAPVTVTFTSTPESFPGALDGTVTAIPAGGTAPYTVQWADELFTIVGSGNPTYRFRSRIILWSGYGYKFL
jgi:hypothetical protein